MTTGPIETDYLVVGAGATAMAFVDTLLTESEAQIVIVDRHHRPGGHWNDAYPFVRLHQPSAFYGVASRELSSWTKDKTGLNEGLYGLASGAEVLAHFDQVMQQRFLPSGRVRWFPMSEVSVGPGTVHTFNSLTSGETCQVQVRRKLVDATHARTEVPSTRAPKYAIAPGVRCAPLNDLPRIERPHAAYTVVGSGKTGMDACLWLLQNGVPPSRIRWIMPRDAWLMDRANHQPGADDFERSIGSSIAQFEAVIEAASVADLFARLEAHGELLRIAPEVEPTTYRCAIVSQGELAQLRRIEDVVRLGHLKAIEPSRILLERGTLAADPDTLYIDCSAGAIQMPPPVPVFDGSHINLLFVRTCQPVFSAALIAFVESHYDDPVLMNALCTPVPSPELPIDWLRMLAASVANAGRWRKEQKLGAWLAACRLNFFTAMLRGVDMSDTAKTDRLKESSAKAGAAAQKASALLAASG
ncbi:MAG: FAD/NAD(P)-binding protein [Burkholderiales bacterium]